MHVSSVSIGRTKNLGNFNSVRIDVSIELEPHESFDWGLSLADAILQEALDEPLDNDAVKLLNEERERVARAFIQREEK